MKKVRDCRTFKELVTTFGREYTQDPRLVVQLLEQLTDEFDEKERKEIWRHPILEELTKIYSKISTRKKPHQSTQRRYSKLIDKIDEYSKDSIYNYKDDELDMQMIRTRPSRYPERDSKDYKSLMTISLRDIGIQNLQGFLTGDIE